MVKSLPSEPLGFVDEPSSSIKVTNSYHRLHEPNQRSHPLGWIGDFLGNLSGERFSFVSQPNNPIMIADAAAHTRSAHRGKPAEATRLIILPC